jgi:polyhydroxyalkanoate synthesis regulator phasin
MSHFYNALNELYTTSSEEVRAILERLDEAVTKDEEISEDRIDALLTEIDSLDLDVDNLRNQVADLESELETFISKED